MPIIKPIVSGTSVKSNRIQVVAEENLRIGVPVALQGIPTEVYAEVPAEKIGTKIYNKGLFSPDNKLLALYTYGFPVLYDITYGVVIEAPKTAPIGDVFAAAFSPDGKQFAVTCSEEDAAYIYDTTTRPFTLLKKLNVTRDIDLVYNRTGTRVVLYDGSVGSNSECKIYDTSSFKELTSPTGLVGSVEKFLYVTYSPDNSQMTIVYRSTVSSASSLYIGIFDNRGLTPTQVAYYTGSDVPVNLHYNSSGSSLISCYNGWHLFDVTANSIAKATYGGNSANGVVLLYHPTGSLAIEVASKSSADSEDNRPYAYFRCINTSGKYLKDYAEHRVLSMPNTEDVISIHAACISPDGTLLAIQLQLYNGKTKSYDYLTQIHRIVWHATRATYKTQQFAQGIGCVTQNIKAGDAGSALRII